MNRRTCALVAPLALVCACAPGGPSSHAERAASTGGAPAMRAATITTKDGGPPGLSQLTPVASDVALVVSDGTVWWSDGVDAHAVATTLTTPLLVGAVGGALLVANGAGTTPPGLLSVAGGNAAPWSGPAGVAWQRGAVAGGVLYFSGWDAAAGTEPWRTDGTAAGTWRVADLSPGSTSSSPRGFMASGDRVYFAAIDATHGSEPWVTDGTEAGTHLLADIFPGAISSACNFLAPDGRGGAFFSASRAAFDKGLWHTDGTAAGTERIADVDPGTGKGASFGLLVDGVVYFHGTDAIGTALWRSDGTPAGTWLVKRGTAWIGDLPTIAALGGLVYFSAQDAATGWELWRTDGSAGSAERVLDVLPGAASGVERSSFLAVPEAGVLLFDAQDASSLGRELWVSDGTGAGTRLLQDLAPGATSGRPAGFVRAGDRVFFHASADAVAGRQLWSLPLAAIDRRPPIVSCPPDAVAEATGPAGAAVAYAPAVASDAVTASPALAYSAPSGATFALGETAVTATATDEAGNAAACSFRVTVRDTTPPAIVCPPSLVVKTSSRSGTSVVYPAPTAADAVTAAPTVTASPPSGSFFRTGTTTLVTATAVDQAGNTSTCSFKVTVKRR